MATQSLEILKNIDPDTWRKARRALEKAMALYLKDPNVSHIDLGCRMLSSKGNAIIPELTVRVHVHQKLYGKEFEKFARLYPDRVIDAQKVGFPVDVIEASYSLNLGAELLHSLVRHKHQLYEQDDGMSLVIKSASDPRIPGGKVRDCVTGEELFLSCWHVIVGLQQATSECSIDRLKSEAEQQKISVDCIRDAMSFHLDAAVVPMKGSVLFSNEQQEMGMVKGVTIPQLGMLVKKYGTEARVTRGVITGVLGYSTHWYGDTAYVIGPIAHIAALTNGRHFCTSGDSGAWWLEQTTRRAVALHFAGSDQGDFGLALSMPDILKALQVEIVTEPSSPPVSLDQSVIRADQITKLLTIMSKNLDRVYSKLAHIFLLAIFCLLTMKLNSYQSKLFQNQNQQQIDQAQRTLDYLKAINQLMRERDYMVKKIIAIIDRFNPEMGLELKTKIANEIYEMTRRYSNLNIELICATITHETGLTWDPSTVSPAKAIGLMQILPATGVYLAQEEGLAFNRIEELLFDPIFNIRLGCRYLAELVSAYGIDGGLVAYNGGMRRAEIWLRHGRAKGILPEETENYAPSILKIYAQYRDSARMAFIDVSEKSIERLYPTSAINP